VDRFAIAFCKSFTCFDHVLDIDGKSVNLWTLSSTVCFASSSAYAAIARHAIRWTQSFIATVQNSTFFLLFLRNWDHSRISRYLIICWASCLFSTSNRSLLITTAPRDSTWKQWFQVILFSSELMLGLFHMENVFQNSISK